MICGDRAAGSTVTLADGEAAASANPNVRLVRIAGAGHNPHRDDPEAVWQALAGWLAARLPERRAQRDRRMACRSVCHWAGVSTSRPASWALLSRIAEPPPGSGATSTQLPPLAEEQELFCHARSFIARTPYFP